MTVLVTGANGFLGGYVVKALLARGQKVRAVVRPAVKVERLGWPSEVEVYRADLRTATDLEKAFDGIDVLVHLAASVAGGEDLQLASSAGGTERLLEAMARTACKRLVLASSFAVYDWSKIEGVLDENSPLESGADLYDRDGYTIAKSWQEKITRRYAEKHGWDLTVLRPGFIWGKDHTFLASLGIKIVGGVYLVIAPFGRTPLTHVENCADLFALAAVDPRARGETFNVVDDEGVQIWSFLGTYLRGTGERALRVPFPYQVAYGAIRLARSTVFKNSRKLPTILVPSRFESRLKPLRYSNQKAREVLGWRPTLDLAECIARSFPNGG